MTSSRRHESAGSASQPGEVSQESHENVNELRFAKNKMKIVRILFDQTKCRQISLTHPSVMKGTACFAITSRLSWSFFRKICPRFNMIDLTSSIVLSSSFGEAKVMKQMNSSLAEHTDVIGFPLFLSTVTADLIVLTSSWIVVTKKIHWSWNQFVRLWKKSKIDETHNSSSLEQSAAS